MPKYVVRVGNVEMVSLTDGHGDVEPAPTFPESAREHWRSEYPDLLDENGHIHPRYGSVAVRSGGKLIIVDTGLQDEDGQLLEDMQRKGVDRQSVDLVVMTHLHSDHVGWNLTGGRPTFPRARYLVPKADWEFWTQPSVLQREEYIGSQVVPLDELKIMDLIEGDYNLTDELKTVDTSGHTPGHISIRITSAGQRGFILGDVAHSPAQAHHTRWNPEFDMDHIRSRKTRLEVVDMLEADGSLVSAGHFPEPGFGRFVRRRGRRVWQGV